MSPAVGFFLSWCHISIVHSTINQPTVVLWYVERPTLLTHQGPLAVPIHFWFWKRRIRSSSWNLILKENELLETAVHSLLRLEGRRCRQLPAVSLLPANLQCPSMTIHGFVDSGCCDIAFIQCRQPVHLPRKRQRCIKGQDMVTWMNIGCVILIWGRNGQSTLFPDNTMAVSVKLNGWALVSRSIGPSNSILYVTIVYATINLLLMESCPEIRERILHLLLAEQYVFASAQAVFELMSSAGPEAGKQWHTSSCMLAWALLTCNDMICYSNYIWKTKMTVEYR